MSFKVFWSTQQVHQSTYVRKRSFNSYYCDKRSSLQREFYHPKKEHSFQSSGGKATLSQAVPLLINLFLLLLFTNGQHKWYIDYIVEAESTTESTSALLNQGYRIAWVQQYIWLSDLLSIFVPRPPQSFMPQLCEAKAMDWSNLSDPCSEVDVWLTFSWSTDPQSPPPLHPVQ